jgi:hypothetical protein
MYSNTNDFAPALVISGAVCVWILPPLESGLFASSTLPASVDGRIYNLPGGHSQTAVVHVTLYAGCKRFVSAAEDGVIIVWDTDSVRPIARMEVMIVMVWLTTRHVTHHPGRCSNHMRQLCPVTLLSSLSPSCHW